MKHYDKKLRQIQLQHEIGNTLMKETGVSCHFDYHVNLMSDDETVKLNLLTYNPKHDEYMLYHSTKGSSSLDCLAKMEAYTSSKEEVHHNSYTIRWSRTNETTNHVSYFSAISEKEALEKFLHERDEKDYTFKIELNPMS